MNMSTFSVQFNHNLNIAGYNDSGLTSCEKYDVQKDLWKEISPMNRPQYKFGVASGNNDNILLFGGKYNVFEFMVTGL